MGLHFLVFLGIHVVYVEFHKKDALHLIEENEERGSIK